MPTTTATPLPPTLAAEPPAWARVVAVSQTLWRVAEPNGRVRGHVRAALTTDGWRFAAERFSTASRSFRSVGEFWSAREALECLRHLS